MVRKFNRCQKCNRKKRLSRNPCCQNCINHKSYNIDKDLTKDDIEWLVEETNIFTHRLLITQHNWFSLQDMNMIIDLHERIYNRDYIGDKISSGQQIEIMWSDILRFLVVYKN